METWCNFSHDSIWIISGAGYSPHNSYPLFLWLNAVKKVMSDVKTKQFILKFNWIARKAIKKSLVSFLLLFLLAIKLFFHFKQFLVYIPRFPFELLMHFYSNFSYIKEKFMRLSTRSIRWCQYLIEFSWGEYSNIRKERTFKWTRGKQFKNLIVEWKIYQFLLHRLPGVSPLLFHQ